MNKSIKYLALINLAFLFIVMGLTIYLERYLPIPLQEYIATRSADSITTSEFIVTIATLVALIAHATSLIGVYLLKSWARNVLIGSTIIMYAGTPFFGAYISHGLAAALDGFTTLLLGCLIMLILCRDGVFNKANQAGTH